MSRLIYIAYVNDNADVTNDACNRSNYKSASSSTSTHCVCEQRRLWRDCADGQAVLSLCWSTATNPSPLHMKKRDLFPMNERDFNFSKVDNFLLNTKI